MLITTPFAGPAIWTLLQKRCLTEVLTTRAFDCGCCKIFSMRLTPDQVQAIRQVAQRELGDDARVRLFGSQVLDDRRGGDIDSLLNARDAARMLFNVVSCIDSKAKELVLTLSPSA
jgi:hypothetical protein